MMRLDALSRLAGAVALAGVLCAGLAGAADSSRVSISDDFSGGMAQWLPPRASDWQIGEEGGNRFLRLAKAGYGPGIPRRPLNYALLRNSCVSDFTLETRLRRSGKSMMIVFDYQDTLHFNYVHLSADRGTVQPVHNGIFRVDDGPRVRIDNPDRPPALPDENWHTVKIVRHGNRVDVYVDGSTDALLSVDHGLFPYGRVGIGSFDETGDYDDFRLDGAADHGCDRVTTKLPAIAIAGADGKSGIEFAGIRQWQEYDVEAAALHRRDGETWKTIPVDKADVEAMIAGRSAGRSLASDITVAADAADAPYLQLKLRKK